MAADLLELHERLSECAKELDALKNLTRAHLQGSISIFERMSPGRPGWTELCCKYSQPIPIGVRTKAGTIANELRAVLDALACTLAVRNNKTVNGVYFPVSKSIDVLMGGNGQKADGLEKLKKLSQQDIAQILSFSPYREGNLALWRLHEADRVRKHQNLLTCQVQSTGGIHNGRFGTIETVPDAGLMTEVGVPAVILRGQNMNIEISLISHIAYAEPEDLRGQIMDHVLQESMKMIGSIVMSFD